MSDTVIQVSDLWKKYRLGTLSTGALAHDITRWWNKFRGKPDSYTSVDPSTPRKGGSIQHNSFVAPTPVPLYENEFWALRDVNFEVKRGEILAVIGRNGAGKSTLLKILSRVTSPTHGKICVKGRIASLLEVGTGFHPELTGRENIFLNGAILGMTKVEIRNKLDDIVTFAEVGKFIDTPVKRYSSGMYVRLAFAVAAYLEPEILIVDEVLAVGDAAFQKKCLGKMSDVAASGRTVLFVTHHMPSVQHLCTSAMLMIGGRMALTGDSTSVSKAYTDSVMEKALGSRLALDGFIYRDPKTAMQNGCAVTGIQLLDHQRKPIQQLSTWDPVCFRIYYSAERSIAHGSVVLQIMSRENAPLILCSTQPDSTIPCSIEPGQHYADCIFDRWPLAEGEYLVGAGLAIPRVDWLWWKEDVCTVHVCAKDVFRSGLPPSSSRYFVVTDHSWQLSGSHHK